MRTSAEGSGPGWVCGQYPRWALSWAGSHTSSQCCQLIFFFFTQYYCAEGGALGLLGDGSRDSTPFSVSDGAQICARKGWGKQTPHNSKTDRVDQAGMPGAEGHCLFTSCRDHLLLWFLESVMLPWGLSCHCPHCSHMHTMFLRSFIPLFTYGAGDGTQGLCTSARQADRQALYHWVTTQATYLLRQPLPKMPRVRSLYPRLVLNWQQSYRKSLE